MSVATVIVTLILALVLAYTGYATLAGRRAVRQGIIAVGFPPSLVWLLGIAQLSGAIGIVAGLWWPPLAIAAAVGLVGYFLAAVGAHLRVGHPRQAARPAVILLGSIAALALVIATA
jgi:uncharacterized membrane protein YphA (DoxX/SURF4 family)